MYYVIDSVDIRCPLFFCCSTLVNRGVLLLRDVMKNSCSWWFAIPGVSPFIKSLMKGRDMVLQILKKSKYKELLRSELLGRKLTVSKLPMEFHVHDIIGADLVEWYGGCTVLFSTLASIGFATKA